MAVPVVLVAGFLGAGKTTLVNHLLAHAGGRRIAAVVNDFGALDIDASLVAGDGVVGLANGCICCTLQGDLLRTIGLLLRRDPAPEGIVIETSGVANPGPIVDSLLDPVIWREAPLDAVIGLVDAADALETPARLDEALYRAQLAAADFVVLNKLDLVPADAVAPLVDRLRTAGMQGRVLPAERGRFPMELLFAAGLHAAGEPARRAGPVADRFASLSWTADRDVALAPFQALMQRLAPHLVRAKGVLELGGRPVVFQMVGRRATLAPGPAPAPGEKRVRLVLIHEIGALDEAAVRRELESCLTR